MAGRRDNVPRGTGSGLCELGPLAREALPFPNTRGRPEICRAERILMRPPHVLGDEPGRAVRAAVFFVVGLLVIVTLSGCVTTGPDLVNAGRIEVEVRGRLPGPLQYVRAKMAGDLRLRVYGRIAVRHSSFVSTGHLDLGLSSMSGEVLATGRVRLVPMRAGGPVRRVRHASFRAWLPLPGHLPEKCTLLITCHRGGHEPDTAAQ